MKRRFKVYVGHDFVPEYRDLGLAIAEALLAIWLDVPVLESAVVMPAVRGGLVAVSLALVHVA